MTVQQLSLERGSEAALKKKKIICTNLVYFQSVITMTFHLPLTHIALFPGVFLLQWIGGVMIQLFHRIKIYTQRCLSTYSMGCRGDQR